MLLNLMQMGTFTEEMTKFFVCQLIISLGYLHHNNIVYRDLKLENVLIADDGMLCVFTLIVGYIKLVDFGISK